LHKHNNIALPLSITLLIAACFALTLFGIVGVGRGGGHFSADMRYLYVAGELWHEQKTPYNADVFKILMRSRADIISGAFAYPPNSAPFALLLASTPIPTANIMMATMNVAALGCIVFYSLHAQKLIPQHTDCDAAYYIPLALVSAAIIVGNPFSSHVVWLGQTTLLAVAFTLLSWLLAHSKHNVMAGIFLAFGAFKPQLVFLFSLWFFFERRWSTLLAAACTTAILSAWPIMTTGIDGSWIAWLSALKAYQGDAYNVLNFKHVFGIRSLLHSVEINAPPLILIAGLAATMLYLTRDRYEYLNLPGPLFAISALLIYAHDYDLAAVTIMALPLLLAVRKKTFPQLLLLTSAFILFFPQRILQYAGIGAVVRSREIALVCILLTFAIISTSTQARSFAVRPRASNK
jgi:hypothetical protein